MGLLRHFVHLIRLWRHYYQVIRREKLINVGLGSNNTTTLDEELENLLDTLPGTVFVDTEKLVSMVLDWEREEEIRMSGMLTVLNRMEADLGKMRELFHSHKSHLAKLKLYELFLPSEAWISIFTKERIESWQTEIRVGNEIDDE